MVVELLPNMTAFIVSGFIFTVIFAILAHAGLAFLGLGNTNLLSWGNMLYWAQADQALSSGAWWWFVPPGLCIAASGHRPDAGQLRLGRGAQPAPAFRPPRSTAKPKALQAQKVPVAREAPSPPV